MARTKKQKKRMLKIGLTGGIGMGKSTVAKILKDMNFPVYHADHAVHQALKKGGAAVKPIAKIYPEAFRKGAIDRKILGKLVFGYPKRLQQLEKILHPLVWKAERVFLKKARKTKVPAAILEIPLLFETGGEGRFDAVLCVMAPASVQKARVMARPGMTEERFKAIRKRQMPEHEKRRKADYVIPSGKSLADTKKHLKRALIRINVLDHKT